MNYMSVAPSAKSWQVVVVGNNDDAATDPDAGCLEQKKTFVQQIISFAIIYKAKKILIPLKTYRYRPTYSAALRSCTSLGGRGFGDVRRRYSR